MSVLKVTNVRVLRGGRLVSEDLWVAEGKVIDPETRFWAAASDAENAPSRVVDGRGGIVAPGFIDVQINGAFGFDFSEADITEQQIKTVAHQLLAGGVTGFCPTLVSSRPDLYNDVMSVFRRVMRSQESQEGQPGARIFGMHLEGPFINPERRGAHDEDVLQVPKEGLKSLVECYGGSLEDVAIVTLAPELEGAMSAIKGLKERGIVASAGHSIANIKVAVQAVENGVTMLTHIFNAMGPFHHRDPGLIGLLGINTRRPYYGMILDGIHSHPTSTRIIERCHPDGLLLVTDAIAGMGLPPGTYELAGQQMDVKDTAAYISGTNTLAGSIVTMAACVQKLMEYTGCAVEQALEAASSHPAQVLGGEIAKHKGSLEFGADADFVLLNDKLDVVQTYIGGQLVFERA